MNALFALTTSMSLIRIVYVDYIKKDDSPGIMAELVSALLPILGNSGDWVRTVPVDGHR